MSGSAVSSCRASSTNYLADRFIARYFEAREYESYYDSLKHAQIRRDFHEKITAVIMEFVAELLRQKDTSSLDAIIESSSTIRTSPTPAEDLVSEARRLHNVGFDLLEIGESLDLESLKDLYRKAARRYHPDVGGSHELMIHINEAYHLFHQLLCQRSFGVPLELAEKTWVSRLGLPIRTAFDYACILILIMVDIKCDEWALDDAHYWLGLLFSEERMVSAYTGNTTFHSFLAFTSAHLAGRLWAAGMKAEALTDYRHAEQLVAYPGCGSSNRSEFHEGDRYIKHGEKLRFVLNHEKQAKNALRLGLISENRYHEIIARITSKRIGSRSREESLQQYLSDVGFIQDLPTDRGARGKVAQATLIPEPAYFQECLDLRTDDQQAEYLEAFGPFPNLDLVRKYGDVRLSSLLRSMILHSEEVDLGRIEQECRSLALFFETMTRDTSLRIAEVARYLDDLSLEERRGRLEVLRELDEKSRVGRVGIISVDPVSGLAKLTYEGIAGFAVRLDQDYLAVIKLPLKRLQLALRTGSVQTQKERSEERETLRRDLAMLRTPAAEESRRIVVRSEELQKSDPDSYIKSMESHCDMLLGLGTRMEYTEHLQLGYWVDRLTIALVKLNRWKDAEHRLKTFFALPDRYRKRSSASQLSSMRRRLERCRKALGE